MFTFDNMAPVDIAAAEIEDIRRYQAQIDAAAADVKLRVAKIKTASDLLSEGLEIKFGEQLSIMREEKPKGVVSWNEEKGVKVSQDNKQTVTWDSDKLSAILEANPDIAELADYKVEIKIPENKWKKMKPAHKAAVAAARTTSTAHGAVKIIFEDDA